MPQVSANQIGAGSRVQPGAPSQLVNEMLIRKAADDEVAKWKDTISHELYDTALLTAGQVLAKGDYDLFAIPIGERANTFTADAAAFTKTEEHTNLTEARRLSSGRAMSVRGMFAHVTIPGNPDTTEDQTAATTNPAPAVDTTVSAVGLLSDLQNCIGFELTSDETRYERGKLRRFTSPQGISGFAGSTANNSVANNGLGRGYRLPIPRDIWGNRDFGVIMRVFRAITITRATRIEFCLDGFLVRPAR